MGASYRTYILFLTIHLISSMTAQEMDKRGPQGFLGMRGKKLDSGEYMKRKPQFFIGVKGKKMLYDIFDTPDVLYKRTPMGFIGMRGKKELHEDSYQDRYGMPKTGSLIGQIDYTSNENNEEFPFIADLLTRYLKRFESPNPSPVTQSPEEEESERMTNEIEKRGADMHQFFGVRGKKAMQKRLADLSFRGKFIGVRGKKDLKNSGPQEIKFLLDGPLPKRKAQMGFIGMRGKKWDVVSESNEVETTPNEFESYLP